MANWKLCKILISLSLLAGCGYHWQLDYPNGGRPTVSVPFVSGDENGFLTSEIVRALSSSGLVDIVSKEGDYSLQVCIKEQFEETIGFRRNPQKIKGKVRKNLVATEGRKVMVLEAALYAEGQIAYGPFWVRADADYDYVDGDSLQDLAFTNSQGSFVTVLPFSLGQLEPIDSAQQAVAKPLYARLAQKIVDAISSAW